MSWRDFKTAPTDGTHFVGWDAKQGRCIARQWYVGKTLHTETWAIDPSGLIDPPDPHLWAPLPAPPCSETGIPIFHAELSQNGIKGIATREVEEE